MTRKTGYRSWVMVVLLLCISNVSQTQEAYFVDDEECGCELFFIEGIQTTRGHDGLFGFRLADGTEIVPPTYKYVDRFHNGYCRVYLDEGQCGMIDRTGAIVVPCIYDGMEYPSEGRIAVFRSSHVGYCDLEGREVIPAIFPQGANFSCHRAAVQLPSGQCAFIDTLGRQLFGRTFDTVRPYHHGFAAVLHSGRWGMIDTAGNTALPTVFPAITENIGTLFLAGSLGHMAVYKVTTSPSDKAAKSTQPLSHTATQLIQITDTVYSGTLGFSEGLISVVRNGHYGFVDSSGREVVPCIYDETSLFAEGRTMVRIADRYGIVALERPSREMLADLKKQDIEEALYGKMDELFTRADLVKFAKYLASAEENEEVIPDAVRFVNATYIKEIDEEKKEEK